MKWSNVKLIMMREMRDQLRDRRTLFMIAVLPLLLYPLIGMTFLQVAQFMREHPTKIHILGGGALPADPPLIVDGQFAAALCDGPEAAALMVLTVDEASAPDAEAAEETAGPAVTSGRYDAVVHFPPDFAARLQRFRSQVPLPDEPPGQVPLPDKPPGIDAEELESQVPRPTVFYNTAKDKSRIARDRVAMVLRRWRERLVEKTLIKRHIPVAAAQPFQFVNADVSQESGRRAAIWSKVLPFILMVWALTGAFYPAVDLCAGEKERGTLETLLSSPAERREIVWGKLLTVMFFSMATALLNLISMGLTGTFVLGRIHHLQASGGLDLGPPPLATICWLLLALIPVSALFSALSLALAALARSTKEGQYYLIPLILVTTPLMVLPVLPACELDLGNSLIPITGVMLILRKLIEGEYALALKYCLPVAAVTIACCLLAIRWAVDQFNNESVLFRESERLELGTWLKHVVRDRGETPSIAEALLCAVILLLIRFFGGFLISVPDSWNAFAITTMVVQLAFIATPALIMATILTANVRRTLLLNLPSPAAAVNAMLLAVFIHPVAMALAEVVQHVYPLSPQALQQLQPIQQAIEQAPGLFALLVFLALTPALCEEVAFRGFILSGLRHTGHKWTAILVSSVFFGVTHGLLQQSLTACAVGMVLGYLAVQTGSLLPCVLFHLVHNSLGILASRMTVENVPTGAWTEWVLREVGDRYVYQWPVVAVGGMLALGLLYWFRSLPYQLTAEERLHDALARQSATATQ